MKQKETLEDFCIKFIEKHFDDEKTYNKSSVNTAMKVSAKWQKEQDKNKYSEEEVIKILYEWSMYKIDTAFSDGDVLDYTEWFEQFKKK